MTVESTLKSSEIATCLVQVAIKKHRDRYENTFIKAVSLFFIICGYLHELWLMLPVTKRSWQAFYSPSVVCFHK